MAPYYFFVINLVFVVFMKRTFFEHILKRSRNEKFAPIEIELCSFSEAVQDDSQKVAMLHDAVQHHNLEEVASLLDKSDFAECINSRDSQGFTALHIAAKLGHVDMVKLLLNKGADINMSSSTFFGSIPYMMIPGDDTEENNLLREILNPIPPGDCQEIRSLPAEKHNMGEREWSIRVSSERVISPVTPHIMSC
jgi:hypothetical protein